MLHQRLLVRSLQKPRRRFPPGRAACGRVCWGNSGMLVALLRIREEFHEPWQVPLSHGVGKLPALAGLHITCWDNSAEFLFSGMMLRREYKRTCSILLLMFLSTGATLFASIIVASSRYFTLQPSPKRESAFCLTQTRGGHQKRALFCGQFLFQEPPIMENKQLMSGHLF